MITVIKDKTDNTGLMYEAVVKSYSLRSSQPETFQAQFTTKNPNIKIGFFCDNMDNLGLTISDAELELFYTYKGTLAFYTYFTPVTFNGRLL